MMKKRIKLSVLYLPLVLLSFSCVDGYDDKINYDPGVYNTTLESPSQEKIKFSPSTDGKTIAVVWDVVLGAGGYEYTFYNADDPDNLVPIGEANQFVDGCSVKELPISEDTKYLFTVRSLGNEKYNNKEAAEASKASYDTFLPRYQLIPAGTNLTEYFAENEVPDSVEIDGKKYGDIAYELEAGANYTISGELTFGGQRVILRGDKINHPQITVSGKIVTAGAGIKLQYLDFDFTGNSKEFIRIAEVPDESVPKFGNRNYAYAYPLVAESCTFYKMTSRFLYGTGNNPYLLKALINNCYWKEMELAGYFIEFSGQTYISNFEITNSTFDNAKGPDAERFLKYGNGAFGTNSGNNSAILTWENNTFYNVAHTKNMANYNTPLRNKAYTVVLKRNIFVDCGNQQVVQQLACNNSAPVRVCDQNSYWYKGAFPENEVTNSNGDTSGTHFDVDPQLADPQNGNFTVGAQALKDARIGDPRWLPEPAGEE